MDIAEQQAVPVPVTPRCGLCGEDTAGEPVISWHTKNERGFTVARGVVHMFHSTQPLTLRGES